MKVLQKTISYRLELTKEEQEKVKQFAGSARYIFNHGLDLIKKALAGKQKVPTYKDIANLLPLLKKSSDTSWLSAIHSQVLQQSLKDLESGMNHFYRRLKKKEKPGFPRFKKRGQKDSFRYPQGIKLTESKIYLPKIGWIRYINSWPIEGNIKQVTVKREAEQWYVHLACQVTQDIQVVPASESQAVGIDLGLLSFAHLSDGTVINNPKFLKTDLQELKRLQRKYSRSKKGSTNRKKLASRLAKLHTHIKNKRKDFLHKLSTYLVEKYNVLIVESLTVKNMVKNRRLAQAIGDVGWSAFLSMLQYKCLWYGKHYVAIPKFTPSSKLCSGCGFKQDMPLHKRVYKCNGCSIELDRDLNASINIKVAGMSILHESVNACGGNGISLPGEAGIRGF